MTRCCRTELPGVHFDFVPIRQCRTASKCKVANANDANRHRDVRKARAIVERGLRNVGDAAGNLHVNQVGALGECKFTHAGYTIRNCHPGQSGATIKRGKRGLVRNVHGASRPGVASDGCADAIRICRVTELRVSQPVIHRKKSIRHRARRGNSLRIPRKYGIVTGVGLAAGVWRSLTCGRWPDSAGSNGQSRPVQVNQGSDSPCSSSSVTPLRSALRVNFPFRESGAGYRLLHLLWIFLYRRFRRSTLVNQS
jgi:hypothetical protein